MEINEIIEVIVKALVDNPEKVEINTVDGDRVTIYELKVVKEDIGKVIGKRGRTAGSIRTLLNAISTKQGKRSELEIIE